MACTYVHISDVCFIELLWFFSGIGIQLFPACAGRAPLASMMMLCDVARSVGPQSIIVLNSFNWNRFRLHFKTTGADSDSGSNSLVQVDSIPTAIPVELSTSLPLS